MLIWFYQCVGIVLLCYCSLSSPPTVPLEKEKIGKSGNCVKKKKRRKISEEERKSRKMSPLVGVVGYIKEKKHISNNKEDLY